MWVWLLQRLKGHWEGVMGLCAAAWAWGSWQNNRRISAIDEAADAVHQQVQRLAVEQGAAAAHAKVQETYAAELKNLTDVQAVQAAQLLDDPAALAHYIVRATGTARFPVTPLPNAEPPA